MGYNRYNYPNQERVFSELKIIRENCRFIELGCQQFWLRDRGINPSEYYHDVFGYQWKEIISVDLEGPEWIRKYDLTKPLPDLGKFEIVADFGTAEHIGYKLEEQYQFWVNIHNLGKIDTIYLHDVPEEGSWLKHPCQWRYTQNFFAGLCIENKYKIWELSRSFTGDQGWADFAVYIKRNDDEFMDFERFKELWKSTHTL